MKFEAILFDMDGVIVNTERFYQQRRKTFFDSVGLSIDSIPVTSFIGGNTQYLWDLVLSAQVEPVKFDRKKLENGYATFKAQHPLPYKDLLMDGVTEALTFFRQKGFLLALASNSTQEDINRCLLENDLTAYFSVVLSGEAFPKGKPDPAIYLAAAAELKVLPSRCLVIEDSTKGIAAGKAAGATVWAMKVDEFEIDQGQADVQIEGFFDLKERLS